MPRFENEAVKEQKTAEEEKDAIIAGLNKQVETLEKKNITTLEALAEVYELVLGGGL